MKGWFTKESFEAEVEVNRSMNCRSQHTTTSRASVMRSPCLGYHLPWSADRIPCERQHDSL